MQCTDESVKSALTAPFPDEGLIPISESIYSECSDSGGRGMFVNGDEVGERCELESFFTSAIRAYKLPAASRPPASASEDTFHTLLDTTVVYPIHTVFGANSRRVEFRRNQVAKGEAASSPGFSPETRPDVVFTIGGVAFFFGEEKSEVAAPDAAEKDIKHKSVWTPFTKGTKEFDICYGTLGRRVQFYILRPNGYGGVTLHPIERELHLDRMVDCVLCVKMAINAFRINLWQYDTQRPRNIPDLAQYGKIFRKHCVIESMGSYFLKTIYVLTHADAAAAGALRGHVAARVDAIQAIVERVASGNPPHCVEIALIERKRTYLRYTLEPVHEGFENLSGKPLGTLKNAIWQFPFRNLEEVVKKMNRYSSLGVPKLADKRVSMAGALGHAAWSFIKHYIFKRGFVDGWAGLVIAFGNFEGTFYRYAKRYEESQDWQPPPGKPIRREPEQ